MSFKELNPTHYERGFFMLPIQKGLSHFSLSETVPFFMLRDVYNLPEEGQLKADPE